ncbi:MAG: DNA/RNA non-specific endonuclease [Anaerostipes sp.]|uniref:DNA/RNA non-specific endonuclease n=1 Tax=Anaerostipes sp. TaxID=1872530 RepID=UPI0039967D55
MKLIKRLYALLLAVVLSASLLGCQMEESGQQVSENQNKTSTEKSVSSDDIPDYSGKMTVVVDENQPDFTSKDLTKKSYESYSNLDSEGRCQTAQACVGKDIMPKEERGAIGMVKPSGWHTVKYSNVDGKYLYNRCHLIAYQLTGENANRKNLITGTRSFNVDGMLPYEEMVGNYVRETGNHVLYRVTPVFEEDNLVAKGVEMEAMSVEDKGEDLKFHVFVYNVQDGIRIDYETGESRKDSSVTVSETTAAEEEKDQQTSVEIRGNRRSKVYHCPGQRDYDTMKNSKYLKVFHSEKEAKAAGYRRAQR